MAQNDKHHGNRHRPDNLAERLRARFAPLGGADDLKIPGRQRVKDPPFTFGFDEDDQGDIDHP